MGAGPRSPWNEVRDLAASISYSRFSNGSGSKGNKKALCMWGYGETDIHRQMLPDSFQKWHIWSDSIKPERDG